VDRAIRAGKLKWNPVIGDYELTKSKPDSGRE
jgi:hypothetical protein